jgi:colicin import membrane protein
MFLCSATIHLACFFFLAIFQSFSTPVSEGPVYYVDVVNLPVANPQAGAPSTEKKGSPEASSRQEMTLPQKPSPTMAVTKASKPDKNNSNAETEKQFEERLAKIKDRVAEKDFSNTLAALQKRVAAGTNSGKSGIPLGKGNEAGSDYASYIRSRLTDSFRTTISYQSKNPEAMVRLTIDRNGKVIGLRFEKKTTDRIFEESVQRAILKAEQNFPPPPNGERFEYCYRFAPEGVTKK